MVTYVLKKNFDIGSLVTVYEPEAIDFGLKVNGKTIKWASWNVGATKEYEYGDFYAWGEMTTKYTYSEQTYTYKGYPSILPPENDVAQVDKRLGKKWRMPTAEEFESLLALKDNADYTWEKWALAVDGNGDTPKDSKGRNIRGIRITRKGGNPSSSLLRAIIRGIMDGMKCRQANTGHPPSRILNPSVPMQWFCHSVRTVLA